MSNKENRFKVWAILIFSLLLTIIVPFLPFASSVLFLWLIVLWVFVVAFLFPSIGLFVIILLRPALDIFGSSDLLSTESFQLNTASLFGLGVIAYTARVFVSQKSIKLPPLSFLWLIFLGIALSSIFISSSTISSLSEFLRLLSIFCIFVSAYLILNKDNYGLFIKTIVASSIIPVTLAIYQFVNKTGITLPFEGIYNRIHGTFAHPNLLAYYLVLAISLTVFIILVSKKKHVETLFFFLPLTIYSLVIVLTYTRGAWLALVIVLFIISLLHFRKLLLVLVLTLMIFYLTIPLIQNRVNDLFVRNPDSSISWRQNLWKDAYGYFQEKPVFGHGTGLAQSLILDRRGEEKGSSDPHNDYLKIALENGLVGLVSYSLLLLTLSITLFRYYLKLKYHNIKILGLTLLALSLSFVAMGFADNIIRNTALMWAYWSILGGFFAVASFVKTEHNTK